MIEEEYKFLINQCVHEVLLRRFSESHSLKQFFQINYYYDTDSLSLLRNRVTLRARQKDHLLSLEAKTPVSYVGNLSINREMAWRLPCLPLSIRGSQIGLEEYMDASEVAVSLRGSLVTHRSVFDMGNFEICLDKSCYLGTVDYELELEVKSGKHQEPLSFIESIPELLGLPVSVGKSSRFFSALSAASKSATSEMDFALLSIS
jgi:uncharacterized protein YjbK